MLDSNDVKNILVLENHNHLGDILCSLTFFTALKKKFINSKITLVAAKTSYPIPFFEINPYIDKVLIFEKSPLKKLFSFLKELRSVKYQIGIIPSTKVTSRTLHIINFLSGAKLRVGVKSIDGIQNTSHKFLNVKSDFTWQNKHQLDRNIDIAQLIGCNLSEDEINAIKFNFSEDELSFAKNYLGKNFPDKTKKIIAFHPGAGKRANTWDTKNYIELIARLYNEFKNYVIITKGEVDSEITYEVTKSLNKKGVQYYILSSWSIKNLGAILSMVDVFITNDTGIMHIAGFSNAKLISLFGPTDPLEWAPRGKNQFYIKSKSDDINDISVQEVFELTKRILSI